MRLFKKGNRQEAKFKRQRLGNITNERIVPGDLYIERKTNMGIVVMATYDMPIDKSRFSGTVVKVPDEIDYVVGAHRDDLLVSDYEWVHPRVVVEIKNS